MNVINEIKEAGIIAVVRAEDHNQAIALSKAMIAGGINIIEITFTVPNAEVAISELAKMNNVIIGAGTILNQVDAEKAIKNGAQFIVGPNFNKEVLEECKKNNIPYIPGCMTVQEITNALDEGVEIIKLFPASTFGPKYLKALKGPLPDLEVIPTGGVDYNNIEDWLKAGAVAVGVGGELTSGKTKGMATLTELSKAYVKRIKTLKQYFLK